MLKKLLVGLVLLGSTSFADSYNLHGKPESFYDDVARASENYMLKNTVLDKNDIENFSMYSFFHSNDGDMVEVDSFFYGNYEDLAIVTIYDKSYNIKECYMTSNYKSKAIEDVMIKKHENLELMYRVTVHSLSK